MNLLNIFFITSTVLLGSALSQTCPGIGGTCGAISACKKGLLVRRLCPGTAVCCVNVPGLSQAEQHINYVEGFIYLKGYVPSSGSGVTIASGYDIGHAPDVSSCVGTTIWNKLKPYRRLTTKKAVINAGYNPDNLPLTVTFAEARSIDGCMIAKDKAVADKCSTATTACGSAVLISLAHWCGQGGLINGAENKCAGKKAGENYLEQFCKAKGNDAALGTALSKLLAAHNSEGYSGTFRTTRVTQEIDFLKSCKP